MVTYTTDETVQIEVVTLVNHAEGGTQHKTNTFHFTFKFERPVRKQIMPRLYDEAMKVYNHCQYR